MSDTPRTDAAELDDAHFSDWGFGPSGYVTVDFSRELERELVRAQAAALSFDGWISVDDAKPYAHLTVLLTNGIDTQTGFLDGSGAWYWHGDGIREATHWMATPMRPLQTKEKT